MTISPDTTRQERYGGQLTSTYRARGNATSVLPGIAGTDRDGQPAELAELAELAGEPGGAVANGDKPRLPSLDLEPPREPVFSSDDGWWDGDATTGSLADHPLLRGLLLELPPKGSTPPPGWLDRWFEATRSILELLYVK